MNVKRPGNPGKKIQLMATCLCDAFFDDVAKSTVEVLEYLGCEIEFPEAQTCCGQPAFNAGDWSASRRVVRHCTKVFSGDKPVIVPSGSCAAMLFHGALLEFENEDDLPAVEQLAARSWEVADYIVNGLGIKEWPGTFPGRVAFHRSCHTRGTRSGEATQTLLRSIDGLEVAEYGLGEQCCGFGGTFSVTFPNISAAMGRVKLDEFAKAKPDYLVSGDMSCLMHMGGLAEKAGHPVKTLHVIQVLHTALKDAGLLNAESEKESIS